MAAERLALAGWPVHVFDAMPSVGRKFLLAGKGGLNLTHAEAFEAFAGRYGSAQAWLQPLLQRFGAEQLRAWALGLGVDTFVGTSGRVFPQDMKAAPLLRAWLQRLRSRVCSCTCATAGRGGMHRARCTLPRLLARAAWPHRPRCWHWAGPVGHVWVLMRPGYLGWRRAALP